MRAARPLAAAAALALLSGCAAAPMLTPLAFGASAGSVVATDRPISDHAASAVTGRDCRARRALAGGDFCAPTWEHAPTAADGASAFAATTSLRPGVTGPASCARTRSGMVECGPTTASEPSSILPARLRVVQPR